MVAVLVISVLGDRQEGHSKFEASLVYIMNSRAT